MDRNFPTRFKLPAATATKNLPRRCGEAEKNTPDRLGCRVFTGDFQQEKMTTYPLWEMDKSMSPLQQSCLFCSTTGGSVPQGDETEPNSRSGWARFRARQ